MVVIVVDEAIVYIGGKGACGTYAMSLACMCNCIEMDKKLSLKFVAGVEEI
jgi:hypothetical protein